MHSADLAANNHIDASHFYLCGSAWELLRVYDLVVSSLSSFIYTFPLYTATSEHEDDTCLILEILGIYS